MRKSIRLTLLCFLALALFTSTIGCRSLEYSDTDDVARKQDVHADTGQSTAYFDGRIYYISQEDGEDGIYSMLEDGSDVHFELSVPKITRMIVTQDYIYYVGAKSPEEYEGQKVFSLYQFDRSTF